MFVPDGPSFSLYVDKVAQQGPDGIVLGEVVFEPGMKSLVGIGRQGPTLDAFVQLRPKLRQISEDTYASLDWWDGVLAHATLAHAILAHVIMAHCYKNDSVWRIVLKWRIVIFSSQNVIMAHCNRFILECRIAEVIVQVMRSHEES